MLIGELAARTQVSPRSLRYYEAQGLLTPHRGPNGYREYDEAAVVAVRQVRALLAAGLATDVIRVVLPCVRGESPGFDWCADLRGVLEGELERLDERIAGLRLNRRTLAEYLARQPR